MAVKCYVKKVTIPTYEIEAYDKNPMFLEKRVYQGSSGRVYPHPVCEGVKDEKVDKEYEAVFLENDYIFVMLLPKLGGRVQRLLDKTNGYDAVYYNEVVKPALVGLAGPWISGGIEFNWPQHHRPSTFDPVDYCIVNNEDGSVTVWMGEVEKMFHTKGEAGFTVYPDKAYLEIKGRVYNPTERPQTFLWWANPAVAVNDYTRSIFPPDVSYVYDHGKRDMSKFPIADGVYYKVDYSPGTDISRYKNISVPTSYMAHHSDYDFIGNYDDEKEAGLLHVADHHLSPGKKQWTWGNGDFGRAWDRNLTDENGPYIELMTGMFTDNQPDFTYLKPYGEKTFTQYFMPYKKCGAVKNANREYAINLEKQKGSVKLFVYSSCDNSKNPVTLLLSDKEGVIFSKELSLKAAEAFETELAYDKNYEKLSLCLQRNNKIILSFSPKQKEVETPKPAEKMDEPSKIKTNEELFLCGMHLEQYRHATYRPEDYYLEGLHRDPTDIRINNAYGRLLYNRGLFEESIKFFKAAITKSILRNPNPYDCEPYFNLGLALEMTGNKEEAFDAYYKATWDEGFRGRGFFRLALIETGRGNFEEALSLVETSLETEGRNIRANALKACILRHMGNKEKACENVSLAIKKDPLDIYARFEGRLNGTDTFADCNLRFENEDYIEAAMLYIEAGLYEDADTVLSLSNNQSSPMINYYRFFVTDNKAFLEKGENASSLYCFPNRLFDILVLTKAKDNGGNMAAYYLGLLWYDRGIYMNARMLWTSVEDSINLPTVHRNLALCLFNKYGDKKAALFEMEKAFEEDKTDARILFERDLLYKELGYDTGKRLAKLTENEALLEKHDPLYTEYITLLNDVGQYEKAYKLIMSHKFHPWEGGEGKITSQYRRALMALAEKEKSAEAAKAMLVRALSYPENLGEGKLIGQLDNDIYYMLGKRESEKQRAEEYFNLAKRGSLNLNFQMYYNDQPPEMMYYIALAHHELGNDKEAISILKAMEKYGAEHMNDEIKTDYFAVSLPDFLVFEGDLGKKNAAHCENMIRLSREGLSKI